MTVIHLVQILLLDIWARGSSATTLAINQKEISPWTRQSCASRRLLVETQDWLVALGVDEEPAVDPLAKTHLPALLGSGSFLGSVQVEDDQA